MVGVLWARCGEVFGRSSAGMRPRAPPSSAALPGDADERAGLLRRSPVGHCPRMGQVVAVAGTRCPLGQAGLLGALPPWDGPGLGMPAGRAAPLGRARSWDACWARCPLGTGQVLGCLLGALPPWDGPGLGMPTGRAAPLGRARSWDAYWARCPLGTGQVLRRPLGALPFGTGQPARRAASGDGPGYCDGRWARTAPWDGSDPCDARWARTAPRARDGRAWAPCADLSQPHRPTRGTIVGAGPALGGVRRVGRTPRSGNS
ncbi:hypothetical protein H4W80_005781 [Nonomuraea angiospora]|uniref:Uncharacterized protein n=1 Tax=Nonomuraea angiospora TaxID=46172 RepID=A0ABR9M3Q3_9ACTN|nr:hypothetical protein [Nonomuraea angiospora]